MMTTPLKQCSESSDAYYYWLGLGLGTGIADLNVTYLRLLSTKTYRYISYGGP